MKPWQPIAALALGFLLGGFAHLWLLGDVGYRALIAAGQSGYGWNTKSIGADFDILLLFYFVALLPYLLGASVIIITLIVCEWWYRRAFPFRRPRLRAFLVGLAAALLGALGAIILNQREITASYLSYVATEQPFESRTIAITLPPMQSFTATCQRALLLALLLTLLAWGGERWLHRRRDHRQNRSSGYVSPIA